MFYYFSLFFIIYILIFSKIINAKYGKSHLFLLISIKNFNFINHFILIQNVAQSVNLKYKINC